MMAITGAEAQRTCTDGVPYTAARVATTSFSLYIHEQREFGSHGRLGVHREASASWAALSARTKGRDRPIRGRAGGGSGSQTRRDIRPPGASHLQVNLS
ncbi:hypothetical protein E2C01_077990 [Portunus trituberculatus]|uniref:Uncharacterized protein n=1 Tax=Portunus trituberculatus TaxID=210409 RepID=A0A5B7ILH5_PORTR|nr:hypothetical protein [Portunus trituberculatus]